MVLIPRLELRQSQVLVMTPQLQQAIKLLQLSNMELADYIERELEQNPLLERAEEREGLEAGEAGAQGGPEEAADGANESEGDPLQAVDFDTTGNTGPSEDSMADAEYENLFTNDTRGDTGIGEGPGGLSDTAFSNAGSRSGGSRDFDEAGPNVEETLSGKVSLRDHLMGQIAVDVHDPADRLIAVHLIDMLDEAGYVAGDLAQVAEVLGCEPARVEATLERLQQFDPPGIFARDLAECLALQLKDRDRLDPAMKALIDHLDLLAKRDIQALSRICGVDADDVADMVAEIRELNPKPALAFDHSIAQPITPDVLMRARPGSGWIIELNQETLPRVLVNNSYYARVNRAAQSKHDKQYIHDCLQSANWLVKSIHQRATTILKVATEIVRQQEAFFVHGVQHLKPLVLRDIAQEIEMHESTVSRVTSNKYMATPRGIYELKYFFTPAISGVLGGQSHSAESVRHRIKKLVDQESPDKVLSDDRIVAILRDEGIDIARRTVAKYREALGIPSSVQRRREKAGVR